ncbi:hypothetical protein [Bradyrhizobium sp.]|uniref:hypothetical protein n=1 Tax=Bradyrhizobium sp. TaxID=376 RepID=UPI0039E2AF33
MTIASLAADRIHPRRAWDWLMAPPTQGFRLAIFGLYALHIVTGLANHAMWLDEVQHWLIVRDSTSLGELIHNLAYEGHPLGWYLLIWPFRLLGRQPEWIQVVQGACALGAAALLLWRGPFGRLELALLLLSSPLLFEYAIKSRSYSLGDLILFAFCAAFVARRSPLLLAVLLALLVNVHAMFGCIALGGLACVAVQRWRDDGIRRIIRRSDAPIFVVLALGLAIAIAVTRQPADSGVAIGWRFDLDFDHVRRTASNLGAFITDRVALDTSAFVHMGLGILLCLIILCRARRAPVAAAFFGVAVAALMTFLHAKYGFEVWHRSLLFIILVAAVWLGRGTQGPDGPALVPRILFAMVLVAQAWHGIRVAIYDRTVDYSAARATARALVNAGLGSAPLFVLRDHLSATVVAYLQAPKAFYGSGMREGSFVIWDKARLAPVDIHAVIERAAATPNAVVLDCVGNPPFGPVPDPRLVELWRGYGHIESCIIYRFRTADQR